MTKRNISEFFRKYTMVIVLVMVVAFFTFRTGGKILLPQNISNLIAQNAYVFVLTTGMLLCILTGGNIDLSVGSVTCFVGAVGAHFMVTEGVPVFVSILIMLATGLAIGIWQGFWIAYRKVPPFIVTLAGMLMFRGLSNVVLNGFTIAPIPQKYSVLFNGYIPDPTGNATLNMTCFVVGIAAAVIYLIAFFIGRKRKASKGYTLRPIAIEIIKIIIISIFVVALMTALAFYKGIPGYLVWILAIVFLYDYITSRTTIGRHLYAVGGNEKATALSGIDTKKVYFFAYANMGLLTAVAAMMTIARLNSATPTSGEGFEMDAIGSCFIGGASAYGGSGTVPGVIIGAILMGVINLGMSIMGVDANWQRVVKGLVVLGAVIFDVESKKVD